MSDLGDLYQQTVLDHNRKPRNFRRLANANRTAEGYNPICGDIISIDLRMEDGVVKDIGFEGGGCAISRACASMMTDAVKGLTKEEAERLFDDFHDAVTGESDQETDTDKLGKLAILSGVKEFPARVKCASLAWHTLRAAMENRQGTVTTE
ncbi:MAG: Fe-S cluster assembly sulfur transfer protein SufU [Dehalococcoidia bacterium]